MPAYPEVIAQVAPAAATETLLYDCPEQTMAEVSSVVVCNRSAVADSIRISVSVGGGATATKDYQYYDFPVPGNDTFITAAGMTMRAGDIVRVRSANGTSSFNLLGLLTTPAPAR